MASWHAVAESAPRGHHGTFLVLACAVLITAGGPARGQKSPTPPISSADSAFAAADIPRAESLYYMAVRTRPRDPVAREELGGYLAKRGASRIAAVLLEEARMFGADPVAIAMQLAPVYESLGDWRALLSLPGAPLTVAQRRRAAWLMEHPQTSRADSTSLSLTGTVHADTLGRITIRIAGRPVVATIVASDAGVIVGAHIAGMAAMRFAPDSATVVLDSINIGAARLTMVPATVDPTVGGVIIGVSALRPMTIALDYVKRRAYLNQLRGTGRVIEIPFIRERGELRVSQGTPPRWRSLASVIAEAHTGRESAPITIDLRVGELRIAY